MSNGEETFTVAIVGPTFGHGIFGGPSFEDQAEDVTYEDRLKVAVPASTETTLGEIIDRAASEVGTTYTPGGRVSEALTGVVFHDPEDESPLYERQWVDTIRVPDADGKPSWNVWWVETRVDELLAAHQAGLIRGDPRRPYLWPVIPQGDYLRQFHETLWTLWNVWEYIVTAYGSYEIGRRVYKRIERGRAAIQGNRTVPWERRLGRPHDFFAYLTSAPRRTEEVASLLGCPPNEAEGVLWGMGFSCDEDGLWRAGGDEAATLLYESVQEIRVLGRAPRRAELEMTLGLEPEEPVVPPIDAPPQIDEP